MFSLSRILMPFDFSERCLGGVRYAIPWAERFRSEWTLLHVVPPIDCPLQKYWPSTKPIEESHRKNWRTFFMLNSAILTFGERVVREGDPAGIITDQAYHGRSDLIMMPTHGYGPFRRLLLGSVTSKVLHDTACGVWTGAHVAQGRAPPQTGSTSHHQHRVCS